MRSEGYGGTGMKKQNAFAYGLMAEFSDAEPLLAAAKSTYAAGYRRIDAFTPMPVHGLDEAIGFSESKVPWTIFICGVLGGAAGFLLQTWVAGSANAFNVGGRPFFSWPTFIPVTFECTVLCAAFGAVIGMFGYSGLPRPYHPVFNAPNFDRASQDRFFLCIEAKDPMYDREKTRAFLESLGAERVEEFHAEEDIPL